MDLNKLKQEAEECMHNASFWLKLPISKENVEKGGSYILKLLEPREKQIQIDAEQIRALQNQNGELTDKVKELEQQVEKMKSDVISERDEAIRVEDVITYTVLNKILAKWGIKEK